MARPIEEVLAEMEPAPVVAPPPPLDEDALRAGAARYSGRLVYWSEARATATFPDINNANNFLTAAKARGFQANRVGAEVRITRREPE